MGKGGSVGPMLAAKYDPKITQKHLEQDGYLVVQPKIDGMRVLFDNGIARSRSWKPWTNRYLQNFARDFAEVIDGWDGEMLPGLNIEPKAEIFREAMSGLRSEDGSKEFTYFLFDNWHPSFASATWEQRVAAVNEDCWNFFKTDASDDLFQFRQNYTPESEYTINVKLCPTLVVTSLEAIDEAEAKLVADGWEGAILRRPYSLYKYGRATTLGGELTKLKRFEDAEAVVVGYQPAYENQNEATTSELGYTARSAHQANLVAKDYLGSLDVLMSMDPTNPTSQTIKFNIGVFRGLSQDDKRALLLEGDKLLGRIVKFTHQGYGGGYDKPRTPVLIGFRDPEDM